MFSVTLKMIRPTTDIPFYPTFSNPTIIDYIKTNYYDTGLILQPTIVLLSDDLLTMTRTTQWVNVTAIQNFINDEVIKPLISDRITYDANHNIQEIITTSS